MRTISSLSCRRIVRIWLLITAVLAYGVSAGAIEPREDIEPALRSEVADATARLTLEPENVRALLQRGDALFFLGRFDEAVRDYDRMISIQPKLGPTHWQRGLALHFAGRYDDAAKQFERFHELDKSDRENGIWRFYAQVKQHGIETARKELLPYEQPDREPLPLVYRLCAGEVQPEDVLKSVETANVDEREKQKRRFYATLYVGLDAAIVRRDAETARPLLNQALENPWPRNAGYGPKFMWHVARLSRHELDESKDRP